MKLPERMPAAVYRGPRELVVEERPVPEPGAGDVLLEVSHCGICGTDLHMVLEGMGVPGTVGGHEWSGRVVASGPDVDGWPEGALAVGGPRPGCGACAACRAGRPSLCLERGSIGTGDGGYGGAFARYVAAPASQLMPVPAGLSARAAALAEPLAVALHALTVGGVGPGERVLVTGAGPLALLLLASLRARGIEDVTVSEPRPLRRDRAALVGAVRVVEPDELPKLRFPFQLVDDPFDVVFECSGNPRAMEAGLRQLRPMGRLVLVGTGMDRPRFNHNRILLNELVLTGAYCYDAGGFEQALGLLASGALPLDLLIEPGDRDLDELAPSLEQLAAGELVAKVMIAPGGGRPDGEGDA